MKPLLKIMLSLMAVFLTTFLVSILMGWLTVEQIKGWLEAAQQISPSYVFWIVVVLLWIDLFLSVPSLAVMILAGNFIGPGLGTLASMLGLGLVGVMGYLLSALYGESVVRFIVKDTEQRQQAMDTFRRHGPVIILLSRAVPMLPEVSACMAGMTRMHFGKFLFLWLLSIAPSAIIASWAGSVSSIDQPEPAIYASIGLAATLWTGWFFFQRHHRKKAKTEQVVAGEKEEQDLD